MAIPKKDSLLVDFSTNFNAKIVASPTTYGLVAGQATAYTAVHTPFLTAYAAVVAAREAGTRSSPLIATKDLTKANLLAFARQLYAFVQNNATVLAADKIALGVHVRDTSPSPIPQPGEAPKLLIQSVIGWTVRIRLKDSTDLERRGKPPGVSGASIFSYVGATAPTSIADWKFEGNSGKVLQNIQFDNTLAAGSKVWLTAFWFNPAKLSGPACDPISTNLQGGGVAMAA